jgi:hypothetical protein
MKTITTILVLVASLNSYADLDGMSDDILPTEESTTSLRIILKSIKNIKIEKKSNDSTDAPDDGGSVEAPPFGRG